MRKVKLHDTFQFPSELSMRPYTKSALASTNPSSPASEPAPETTTYPSSHASEPAPEVAVKSLDDVYLSSKY